MFSPQLTSHVTQLFQTEQASGFVDQFSDIGVHQKISSKIVIAAEMQTKIVTTKRATLRPRKTGGIMVQ